MNDQETIDRAISILESRIQTPDSFITQPADVFNFLTLKLAEAEREVFSVIYLNNQHGVIEYEELFYGTIDSASVHPREVVKSALYKNAAAVILAHNHPSGFAEASAADRRITDRLKSALSLIDVRVLDHIIVAGTNTISFAEQGLL